MAESEPKTKILSMVAMEKYVGKRNMVLNAFAPWCTHCQQLSPVYEQFAKEMVKAPLSGGAEKLIVVRFNADKNFQDLKQSGIGESSYGQSVADAIQGFPTILFLGTDGRAAIYEGERDVESMVRSASSFFSNAPRQAPTGPSEAA